VDDCKVKRNDEAEVADSMLGIDNSELVVEDCSSVIVD